jgi:hypothetical protein
VPELLLGNEEVGEERIFSERLRLWSIVGELKMLGYELYLECDVV